MSMSRKVRPIRKFEASAATFLASLASRCVAMTPASPRLRPRHIRLVIAPSESFAGLVGHFAGGRGREQLRLVDHHQRRDTNVAVGIEQAAEETPRRSASAARHRALEIEHHRHAMLADAPAMRGQLAASE
jgi:hypothetical protein